ncbi:MAG: DSBA oxidoreductase [Candidatus Woesebacteria bacterium GW2011_GWA1_39_21]|uniref:DSBA oxidoreductase n=1 Tax=Candidatus Woesebacteria bacterium GW2011_GWA1_39_21 TaxID=1618550 RepID=A0A0G0QK82_9BACT|nr:MAG: DSBA oxidoreductase [Candidatus Woesebacteria bacterium GW2011_GWA1_39_21]
MTEEKSKRSFSIPSLGGNLTPVLVVLLIVASFFIGSLYTKVQVLEKGGTTVAGTQANNQGPAAAQPQQPTKGVVSVDDDPVLGDKDAPVTIVEFSDYECPFCKRHFDDTYPQLIKKYIETGKAKLVFRDFPLSFHDPMATKEAVAANCAKEQGGDKKYFEFHDEIFKRTVSNGNGLDDAKIAAIATDLRLNISSFNTCLSNKAMEDEVKKDIADGTAAGVSGTPTFLIGKTTKDGKVEGDLVVGAQPFAAFQAVIDPLLQ